MESNAEWSSLFTLFNSVNGCNGIQEATADGELWPEKCFAQEVLMKRILLSIALILTITFTTSAATTGYVIVIQVNPGINIKDVVKALGGVVLDSMNHGAYLLSVPSIPTILPKGVTLELNSAVALPAFKGGIFTTKAVPDWYKNQPAMQRVNLPLAPNRGRGIIIADIDSSLDTTHPALKGHLTAGFDFLSQGNSESKCGATPAQSTSSFLDQSTSSFLDQSTSSFLDQSTSSFLDSASANFLSQNTAVLLDRKNPAHGHGTMVAGILAAMVPDAQIMNLRAFDDNGCADAFRIAKAIRYAVSNGAQVINMSFGITGESGQVKSALDQAAKANVLLVASAGNLNSSAGQAPASFSGVMGVAATDLLDKKAIFSNYGPNAFMDAPGVNIISAYPGGLYAILSGTSFSAPMVSSAAGQARSVNAVANSANVGSASVNIDSLNPLYAGQLGKGRLDLSRIPKR